MNIKAKKSLGQNFLNNEQILKDIANSITTSENDLIIEIGPGKGALTKYLTKKNAYLICYEIDTRFKDLLSIYENSKTKIIYQDFLKSNLEDIPFNYQNLYVIANIPYYITTPIIKHLINNDKLKEMTLLVQKEVAERFTAKPNTKNYNSLTIYLNYYFNIEYLFTVPKNNFTPAPNVDSATIKFTKKEKRIPLKNESIFFNLIRDSFKMKRKTLKNNLSNYNWPKINAVLSKYNLPENIRGEQLSLELFIEIANNL